MIGDYNLFTVSEALRTLLGYPPCGKVSLHAKDMVGLLLSHPGCNSSDVIGVARENLPSEDGQNGTSLNFSFDIFVEMSKHSGLGLHIAREVHV